MKKSFAENCIRYISTATALILALAMLCCANFSASAKDLGSNLTITDTTLLLQDINTTTNTTPAKTKDLIASGAGVEILSTGVSITYSGTEKIYFNKNALPSTWTYSYYYAYFYDSNSTSSGWSDLATHVEDVNGESIYSVTVPNGTWTHIILVNKEKNNTDWNNGEKEQTGNLSLSSGKNYIQSISSDNQTATWSTYSGGSDTPTGDLTIYYKNINNWSTVNIYCWQNSDGNNNNAWPGKSMTKVEGTDNIYKYTISTSSNWDRCIFNDGTDSNKTGTLNIPTDGKNYYNGNGSEWSTLYTVTFDANGYGTAPSTQYIVSQGTATEPTQAPTASGYTFGGWYTEAECTNEYNFSTAVTGNIILYAKWTKNATSEVSEDILEILNGTKVMSYYGYDNSWNTGSKIYVNDGKKDVVEGSGQGTVKISNVDYRYAGFTMPTGTNLTNYNISDKTYSSWSGCQMNVTEPVGGAFYYIQGTDNKVCNKIDPTTAQTSLGATSFTVGTTDKLSVTTKATKATSSTGNSLKYQYYIKKGTNYLRLGSTDITASTSDTTTDLDISTLPKGTYELITMLYDSHIYYVSDTTETDTFTISDSYTVTFNANGHGTDTETTVEPGSTVSAPTPAPTASGYTFGGWYTDENCTEVNKYNFKTPVTGNITLYAKWTANEYTVTFDYKDGTTTSTTKVVTYNEAYGELPNPTRENYNFGGWYLEEEFNNEVTSTITVTTADNHTLYAKWTAKEYNITYMSDGSQLSGLAPTNYTYGVGVTKLPTNVTKDGYTFKGWYDNKGLTGDPVKLISQEATGDKTFYAKWEASKYSITYKSGSTTLTGLEPSEYTHGVGVDTLPTPTKNGYRFVGWYENSNFTENAVTSISNTATGDKTLYAKWIQKYIFLDVSGLDWFYNHSCEGVVFFNTENVSITTTGYTVMKELFTDTSGYETSADRNNKSKLLFVEVPTNITDITKITFARHGIGNYNNNYNITNFVYSSFTTNNCFKMTDNNGAITGSWSTVDYTPVPIDFTVGGNGKVYLNNNYLDSNSKTVDMPITSGTIYADKSATSLKVKATPNTGYEVNVLKVNGVEKSVYISDKSAGGTVDVGTLGDTNTVEVTFKASQSPKIKVIPVANSSIKLSYTDPDGTSKIGTAFDTEYEIQYNSSFTLEITPASGYYVKSVSNNLTPTDTLPKAGTITATATQVKENLTVSYELAKNPTVTIKCYDSAGNEIESGAGITVDDGTEVLATQTKSVSYKSDIQTGAKFTASVNDITKYRFLGFYDSSSASGTKYETGRYVGYSVSVTDDSITTYDVESNITIYAIFSKQYKVTFKYTNLTTFTVNGTEYANESYDYFVEGTMLSLEAAITDDYKLTNNCWTISPENGVTFTPNGAKASYLVGTSDVTITITPEIATYTGQGKWGSRLLRIETSGANGNDPWFAAKFEVVKDSNTTYEWVRFSEVKTDNYECVIPDNATSVEFCRMKPDSKAFSTDGVWNVTSTTLGNSDEKYILYFDMTDSSNWVFKCRKDTSG